ncbi:MAG: P-loop NTPase [Nitrospira sp.]|nr:P-loop NTPase [Nitrospira sp.]MCP9462601.1 P-loop NTPase [Nitrospira sp.]MCP9475922.1 P-loop NTPase [Nitrospira sp.]
MMTAHDQPVSPNSSSSPHCRFICVIGAKGGVGTTTVAVNLAASLRRRFSTPVLLLDWDFAGGTAAPLLGVTARYSLRDVLGRPSECDSYSFLRSLSESSCGVCILPNGHEGWRQAAGSSARLDRLAQLAVKTNPFVIVDAGRACGVEAEPVLTLATAIVLVGTPDVESMLRASRMLSLLDSSPLRATNRLFVINRVRNTDRPVLDEARRHLRRSIDLLIPRDEDRVASAAEQGTPLVATNVSCPFSRAMCELERLIVGADGDRAARSESSWFHRLSSWFPRREAA